MAKKTDDPRTAEDMQAQEMGKYGTLHAKAKSEGKTKKLTPKFIKWVEGASIIGKYLHRSEVEGKRGDKISVYCMYHFETDLGIVKFSLGAYNDGEQGALMLPGKIYVVTFEGKEDVAGGNQVNKFEVIELFPVDTDDDRSA